MAKRIRYVDPLGNEQRFRYDKQGRLRLSIDAEGAQTHLQRDSSGNILEILDPRGQRWQRRYNAQGQLIEQINPLGESTRYQYSPLGLISGITNPLGERWQYLWDNQGRLGAVRNPLGRHTRYQYNDTGQQSQNTAASPLPISEKLNGRDPSTGSPSPWLSPIESKGGIARL